MLSDFFNIVKVEERNNITYVLNVSGEVVKDLVDTTWRHPQLGKYLFTYVGKTFFSFNSFFAPDVVFIINKLVSSGKYGWKTVELLTEVKDKLYKHTWLSRTLKTYPTLVDTAGLNQFKLAAYPKQRAFFKQLDITLSKYGTRGYLLAGVPGSGKTYVGLATSICLKPTSKYRPTIIISPKNARESVWQESITTSLFKKGRSVWVYDTDQELTNGYDYYVFTPESVDMALVLGRVLTKASISYFTIIDESQRFNEMTAIRTHRVIELCSLCPDEYFLWLSGSPIKKLGSEMIPFLIAADPVLFDKDTQARFRKIWGVSPGLASEIFYNRFHDEIAFTISDVDAGKKPADYQDILIKVPDAEAQPFLISSISDEMTKYMQDRLALYQADLDHHKTVIRRTFSAYEDTLTTPDQISEWNLYKDRYNRDKYNEPNVTSYVKQWVRNYERQKILPNVGISLRAEFPTSVSIVRTMTERVRGEALGKVVAKRRAECAYLLASHADIPSIISNAEAKTMIFASNKMPLQKLAEDLKKLGFLPKVLSTSSDIPAFRTDPKVNPALTTFSFLSESVPFLMANWLIMLNKPFRQYTWEQTCARIARKGQTRTAHIRGLVLDTGDVPNISTRGDMIINSCRSDLRGLIGEDFSGPVTSVTDPLYDANARDMVEESLEDL